MTDNHKKVCKAVNEFKGTTASVVGLVESDWQVQIENPVAENKLLPTDVVDRWQLLGIVIPVEKIGALPPCTW